MLFYCVRLYLHNPVKRTKTTTTATTAMIKKRWGCYFIFSCWCTFACSLLFLVFLMRFVSHAVIWWFFFHFWLNSLQMDNSSSFNFLFVFVSDGNYVTLLCGHTKQNFGWGLSFWAFFHAIEYGVYWAGVEFSPKMKQKIDKFKKRTNLNSSSKKVTYKGACNTFFANLHKSTTVFRK